MKVLLLNPHSGRFEIPVYPLGLASLGAALKGHELEGCDLQLEERPLESLRQRLDDFAPEVVAVSLRNVDSSASYDGFSYLPAFEACLQEIRHTCPEARVVVGGPGFSLFPAAIMERFPEIDLGIAFEGEVTLPGLLGSLDRPHEVGGLCYRADGEVQVNSRGPEVDFAVLAPPDRSLFRVADSVSYTHLRAHET